MKSSKLLLQIIILFLFIEIHLSFSGNPINPALKEKADAFMSQTNVLGFQENKGQIVDNDGKSVSYVLFTTKANGINIWITTSGITYQFLKYEKKEESREKSQESREKTQTHFSTIEDQNIKTSWQRVDMILKNATIKKENIITEGEINSKKINCFTSNYPDGIFGIKTFSKITIKNIYDGIDWVLYTNNSASGKSILKQDFVVHPNANTSQIKLIYEGAGNFEITNNQIHFKNEYGELHEGKLFCYQGNENNEVSSKYIVKKNTVTQNISAGNLINEQLATNLPVRQAGNKQLFSYEVTIQTNDYDKSKELIIDPQLVWNTFYGGDVMDIPKSIDSDNSGNVFIIGNSQSGKNFPVLNAGGSAYFQGVFAGGNSDVFILKFNNNGVLLFATLYGGTGSEYVGSSCLDKNGNIFITGEATEGVMPLYNPGGQTYFQNNHPVWGESQVFILKFDNNGQRLWATYFGGDDYEGGNSICVDKQGNIFVGGGTHSHNFPKLNPGGGAYFQGIFVANSFFCAIPFILKFTNSGQLLWSTYYGGNGSDGIASMCIDLNGNLFVIGYAVYGPCATASSYYFPLFNPGGTYYFQGTQSYNDMFILKFTNAGVRVWATFFGGARRDEPRSIACDNNGNIVIVGVTLSYDFPVLDPGGGAYYYGTRGGSFMGDDLFILKMTSTGSMLWSTYFGGWGDSGTLSSDVIKFDNCNNMYFAYYGGGYKTDTSTRPSVFSSCNSEFVDSTYSTERIITKFDDSGKQIWSTNSWVGGREDGSAQIEIDKYGNLFAAAYSGRHNPYDPPIDPSTYNLVDPGGGAYFNNTFNARLYTMVFGKFIPSKINASATSTSSVCVCNGTAAVSTIDTCDHNYEWYNSSWNLIGNTPTISGLCPGTYQVIVYDKIKCSATPDTAFVTVTGTVPPVITISQNTTIITGESATLSASGGGTYNWYPSDGLNDSTNSTVTATPVHTTIYCVEVTNADGCKDTACVTVEIKQPCDDSDNLKLPNAFSPNGDNVNDEYCLQDWVRCFDRFNIIIYDRWGEKVFESTNAGFCWDGIYKGKIMDSQVFVYTLKAWYNNTNDIVIKSGNISLIK